jgi:hypothetical protein
MASPPPAAGSVAYDVLVQGANHFAIAHPLDETTGRFFLDMEMTRPAGEIRGQIARLMLSFIQKKPLDPAPSEQIVMRRSAAFSNGRSTTSGRWKTASTPRTRPLSMAALSATAMNLPSLIMRPRTTPWARR